MAHRSSIAISGQGHGTSTMQSTAVLYPFMLNQPLAYVIANSEALELRSEGPSQQFVALHATM